MKLIHCLPSGDSVFKRGAVVTLGNFDGIHLGHQALLHKLQLLKEQYALPAVLITFEPQPKEFFLKAKQSLVRPYRIMWFRDKWKTLLNYNLDYLWCLRFNHELADLSPTAFIEIILINHLNMKALVVGDDFRFGANRAGDINLLQQFGSDYGFRVEAVPAVKNHSTRISSTLIRELLEQGQLAPAAALLGKPFQVSGRVVTGKNRGARLGFPTANIHLSQPIVLPYGVFVVKVKGLLSGVAEGVASYGVCPTFKADKPDQPVLEVNIFDFNDRIYGAYLEIEFLSWLRPEIAYSTEQKLIIQMEQDVLNAKNYLKKFS